MSRDQVVTITPKGRRSEMARRLPYEIVEGDPVAAMQSRQDDRCDFIVFLDTDEATRVIAPLLSESIHEAVVVIVDEAERMATPLTYGSAGAAIELANSVAHVLDVRPKVPSIRDIPGFIAEGDIMGVELAMLEGRSPVVAKTLDWPTPSVLALGGQGPERLGISDELIEISAGVALLRPPSLLVGIEIAENADPTCVEDLLIDTLATSRLSRTSVAYFVTANQPVDSAIEKRLGRPVNTVQADLLRHNEAPHRCEAAAIVAAGSSGRMIVSRRANDHASIAVVRRLRT